MQVCLQERLALLIFRFDQSLNQRFEVVLLEALLMKERMKMIIPILLLSMLALSALAIALTSVVSAAPFMNQHQQLYFNETTDLTYISVSPKDLSGLSIGQTFTVTVGLSGLADKNLYGFDIKFTWNPSAVQYLSHEVKVSSNPDDQVILNQPVYQVVDSADVSVGRATFAYASLLPAEPSNDDGTVFTVTFTLLASSDKPFWVEEVVLADNQGNIIPVFGFQNIEIPSPPAAYTVSGTLERHRALAAAGWLEWWITVTWRND